MPRKTLLSREEIAIGKRLADWRNKMLFSRTALASVVGFDSSALQRVELGRSRLPYRLAWALCHKVQLNPYWLRTGEGHFLTSGAINPPEAYGLVGNEPFSKVFDDNIIKQWREFEGDWPGDHGSIQVDPTVDGRVVAQLWLEKEIKRLIDFVPDAHLNHLVNSVMTFLGKQSVGFTAESGESIQRRRDALAAKRALTLHRRILLETEKCNPTVDKEECADRVGSVDSDVPTWPEVVKALKRLTSSPGAKAQLAKDLNTSRQNVNKWLNGSGAPGAQLTLSVLRWVRARSAK